MRATVPLDPSLARRYPRLRLHTILLSLLAAGIVHILTTLAWPSWTSGGAVRKIVGAIPVDAMTLLPAAGPKSQLFPFQLPDVHYAACKVNVAEAAYAVRATLPGAGWTLSLHSATGDSVYVVTGQDQKSTDVALLVLPPGERFVGVLPEARLAAGFIQVSMPSTDGVVLIRAPDRGAAYRSEVAAELTKATCTPRRA